ncbi:SDR family NAD(P)-dependent oxidoreductase [Mycolicibacterium litorale]|uniref:3-oxoacyl-[acyl-carrier-protein] reductase MabA n=1 Tax=Mycolicibacterium litorale TaxID=758802 RepID=A0AAD1IMT8_9MYCO|nr:SDR family oxidoreductase [Mycolicibacterium litorale]MCV7415225.1 SDR family oxidoreductase [Mycolicibacterium litorale]TDY08479.1 NAD(P)-dependent dehydrogenase (short-subunit alcohol dehydrogenase family) [Mycolicibacterium litorale]BBY16402.1 3-oxoacyl-ACP reductase [Mycolicibacterium litorale]
MTDEAQRVLVTGVDTMLGAAVNRYFSGRGAVTAGTTASVDHADGAAVRSAVTRAADAMGRIDALVVAHGLPHVAPVTGRPMAEFWRHVDVTLTGSFLYAQAVAACMRDAGTGGRIVLTTSRWHIGGPSLAAVAAAAGGIVALTKTLTRDFGPFGVGVNAVAVGGVDSEWSICDAAAGVSGEASPVGRSGTVDQAAGVIGLLCRRDLGAAVGQIVNLDGGLSRNRV